MCFMPTSRRASSLRPLQGLAEYSTIVADEPITVEVEKATTAENEGQPAPVEEVTLTPGTARWAGIIGFENEMTGDGRFIAEGALRWPEDLVENPIPIRYVASDVGAHDGAQVVGLIDTIERQAPLENGSIPIYAEGVFDDAEDADVAQEAFRHVDKKFTNGVSMDLDDVVFEVKNEGESAKETVQTNDARIRAATIVAIPAFADARIGIVGTGAADTVALAGDPKLEAAATLISAHNEEIVQPGSARAMRAHAITKAKLKRLSTRSQSFAYQTTKVKDPEGNWVETPAAAIDIASNSTPPDDSFQQGLDILNEADMLELGSADYLAKVEEAVPLFQAAIEEGGDRAPDAKQVVTILEEYLAINWPSKDDEGNEVETDGEDGANVEKAVEGVQEVAPAAADPAAKQEAAPAKLSSETETFAYNEHQWRNPANGRWIDMPGRLTSKLLDALDSDESGLNDEGYERINTAAVQADAEAGNADSAIKAKDYPAAQEHIAKARDLMSAVDAAIEADNYMEAVDKNTLSDLTRNIDQTLGSQEQDLMGVPAGFDDEGVGSFDPEEVVEVTLPGGGVIEAGGPAVVPSDAPIVPSGRVLDFDDPEDDDKIEETAIEEGSQALDQLEMEWDQDLPAEALQTLSALDALNLDEAEKKFDQVKALLQDAQDGYLGDEDDEGHDRINFLANIVDTLARTIDRWKSEQNYNNGTDYAYDPEQAVAWAAEFNVPDAQVEEMLQVLATVQIGTPEWDELSSASQGFVKLSRAGVDPKEALSIYLRTLEEMGMGAVEFTYGARKGQQFNWVDDVGGLPKYIRDIADSLMARGQGESRAIATAVNTVKRWSKGGPARKGGKGSVSAKTVAKALAALAEWEAKKAAAKASAETTVMATESSPALVASFATTKQRAHAEEVADNRRELLARVKGEDVVAEAEALTAAAAKTALSQRPIVKLRGNSSIPVAPPKNWFENPKFKAIQPITIDEDGRVYGHLASWNACHVGSPSGESICIMAPKSRTGYAYFHTGAVKTAEGETLATGRLCMNGEHAKTTLSYSGAMSHYDNTTLAVADVRVGEDRFGIWVAGAMRPDVNEKQIRTFRASPVSGDWRRIGGNLELTIGLNVNAPGYPVPRPQGLVASIDGVDSDVQDHELISLVAAGLVPPAADLGDSALSAEDVSYLKNLATELRETAEAAAAAEKKAKVDALAQKMRAQKARQAVAAFAAKRAADDTTKEDKTQAQPAEEGN
ncbi:head maturation protease [Microbacterium phage Hendrix]|uniref:Capsid maturation protease n=1 Tax=Microbacterium phage Hendrix TaxID=2182341 RepID=A0A2U8UUP1_9CAUD|nr:head maturation protease [Microbacterium phage Hendrix]AWN07726.1 hypothetical protein PBI_HENDRIX_55 [Microbacterium phage Hendrix]